MTLGECTAAESGHDLDLPPLPSIEPPVCDACQREFLDGKGRGHSKCLECDPAFYGVNTPLPTILGFIEPDFQDAGFMPLVAAKGAFNKFPMLGTLAADKVMILPADAAARKGMPITTGVLDYFPLAMAEVAVVSKTGNDQHNPGQPLHWSKDKSTDHADCIPRHLIDRGSRDTDGMRHSAKLAWRALALLQTELEAEVAK